MCNSAFLISARSEPGQDRVFCRVCVRLSIRAKICQKKTINYDHFSHFQAKMSNVCWFQPLKSGDVLLSQMRSLFYRPNDRSINCENTCKLTINGINW